MDQMAPPSPAPAGGPPPAGPPQGGRNPLQDLLMKRLGSLSPQEQQMLRSAITPDLAQVLLKVLPELASVLKPAAGPGGPPMAGGPPQGRPMGGPPPGRTMLSTL